MNIDKVSLAERKKQVLALVAQGLQSKEIAHVLGLSDHTVKAYTSWLMSDYSVENRTALSLLYWNKKRDEDLQRLNGMWMDWLAAQGFINAPAVGQEMMDKLKNKVEINGSAGS